MNPKLERLRDTLTATFGQRVQSIQVDLDEVTLTVSATDYPAVALALRDDPALHFEQMIDLCGVDYAGYAGSRSFTLRFASVVHLLSVKHNVRLRLRAFAEEDSFPVLASLCEVWPAANWFEREAFDLYGIMFNGHPDLRRILTDYGFVGHPFRKDFPISGYVEMRYDAEQGRVIYQPVSIAPREITPRIVREESYGDVDG